MCRKKNIFLFLDETRGGAFKVFVKLTKKVAIVCIISCVT